jgi:hypothetical protein
MKKILGVGAVCLLGLCCLTSCASPSQQAVNQDLVDRIAKIDDNGKNMIVKDKHVCLYSLTTEKITLGDNWFYEHDVTDCTKLIQYNNYFELYTKETVYTFSNTVAGYIIY